MSTTPLSVGIVIGLLTTVSPAMAQVAAGAPPAVTPPTQQTSPAPPPAARPTPPTRDPNTPGFVTAKELPDGLPLQGNLDPLALLAGGKALKCATRRILDAFADRPHIFNLGHGILQETPIAHVDELIALVKGG